MSAVTISAKAAPILPSRWQDDKALFFVLVILVFLACLSAMAAHNSYKAAHQWGIDLRGKATVQINSTPDQDGAALQAAVVLMAQEIPGVESAAALSSQEARALLRPWLGDVELPDVLPIPALVELSLSDTDALETLRLAMADKGLDAQIDDHQRWGADIDRAARALQIVATVALVLLLSATSAAAGFATQSGMAARASIINVLEQVGAAPNYIARLFVIRFARLGALAGATGAGLALIAALLFWLMSGTSIIPKLSFGRLDIFVLLFAPVLSGLICAAAAGYSALKSLSRNDYEIGISS